MQPNYLKSVEVGSRTRVIGTYASIVDLQCMTVRSVRMGIVPNGSIFMMYMDYIFHNTNGLGSFRSSFFVSLMLNQK